MFEFIRFLICNLGLGEWTRIPTTYAGGAKGKNIITIMLLVVNVFR